MGEQFQRVALTGGIGAGKSTVDTYLAARGAVIIDYDAISHAITAPGGAAIDPVRRAFGSEAITEAGALDRPWAARFIFAGQGSAARRKAFDAIVHPLIFEEAARQESEVAGVPLVVHDIPLLAEVRDTIPFVFHHVIVVTAPQDTRVERLVGRGMTREDALRRIASQTGDAERLALADIVVDNSADRAQLEECLDDVWKNLVMELN